MKKHVLKEDPKDFEELWHGARNYETRLDDRGFAVGDELLIVETQYPSEMMEKLKAPLIYTGRAVWKKILTISTGLHGLKDGWCRLGLEASFAHFDDYQPDNLQTIFWQS